MNVYKVVVPFKLKKNFKIFQFCDKECPCEVTTSHFQTIKWLNNLFPLFMNMTKQYFCDRKTDMALIQ